MNRLLSVCFLFLVFFPEAGAQEMFGLSNGNYAGNTAWKMNPANLSDTRLKWDVTIIGLDMFVLNDYVSSPKGSISFLRLVDGGKQNPAARDLYSGSPKNLYLNADVMLPSATVSIRNHAVGFHLSNRTYLGMKNVPYHVAKFMYEGLDFKEQQLKQLEFGKSAITGMNFVDWGFSYAGAIVNHRSNFLGVGLNLNLLRSLGGIYLISNNLDYNVPHEDTIVVTNLDMDYGYSVTKGSSPGNKLFPGRGTAVDIGVVYEKKKEYTWSSVYRKNLISYYEYRIGVSLLDLGSVSFPGSSTRLKFDGKTDTIPENELSSVNDGEDMGLFLNKSFLQDSVVPNGSFKMSLPKTFSIQYDRNLSNYWYWNLSLLYPLTKANSSDLTRPKSLVFTPRYESKWLEFGIPLNIYDFQKLKVGFAFRFHSFYIGSDDFLALLGFGKVYGASFYFGFKISAFKDRYSIKDKSSYENSIRGLLRPFWKKRL